MTSLKISSVVKKGGATQHNFSIENANTIIIIFLSLAVIALIIYYKSLENKKQPKNTETRDKIILVNDPFYYDQYYYNGYYDPYYTLYYPSWNDWKWWGSGYNSSSYLRSPPHHFRRPKDRDHLRRPPSHHSRDSRTRGDRHH